MKIVSTENTEHYSWGGFCEGWHLLKSGNLSVIQEHVPPGGTEVRHYHEKAHQFFFVLSGIASLEIQDKKLQIKAQQGVAVPPHTPHRLFNESREELSFLVISSPRSHGDRIVIEEKN